MKIVFPVILLSFTMNFQLLYSQVENISTDRPDQSESPLLTGKGNFQIEVGGSIEKTEEYDLTVTGDVVTIKTHSYPSVLLRYGLSKNVETRFAVEYLQLKQNAKFEGKLQTDLGFTPLTLGAKIKMFTEKGSMPETALLLSISIPFKNNSELQSAYIGSEFRFVMTNTLSNRFSLSYNLGGEWGAGAPGITGIYTLSLGANLIKKLSAFVEVYGFLPEKSLPDHRIDGGFTYLIKKNIQADVSAGIGISEKSPDFFIGLGISIRLPK